MLVACRTAPRQRFINPVEKTMSLPNLGLQGVALEDPLCHKSLENLLKSCSSMAKIHDLAEKNILVFNLHMSVVLST